MELCCSTLQQDSLRCWQVGSPYEEVDITPVIDGKSASWIKGLVDDAMAKGAKMELPKGGYKQEHNLIHPVVLTGATDPLSLLPTPRSVSLRCATE